MEQKTMISAGEAKNVREEIKKAGSHTGFGALVYSLVMAIVSFAGLLPIVFSDITSMQQDHMSAGSIADITRFIMEQPYIGTISIAASLIALFAVFLCFAKQGAHKQLFNKNRSMTMKRLGCLLCIMYLFDSIGTACYQLIELDLNLFGFSTSLGLEMASGKSSTLSMFLYVGIIGPVVEELVFRGFLLRRMEKHGKLVAIFVTSILFGLMHGNLPQVLNATMIGFVLGYIAIEYSLIWTIVLHIFNNLVMCDLVSRVLEGASELVQYLVYRGFSWITAIIAIVIIVRNGKKILSWIRSNLWAKQTMIWTLTSAGMVIAVVYNVISTIQTISLG